MSDRHLGPRARITGKPPWCDESVGVWERHKGKEKCMQPIPPSPSLSLTGTHTHFRLDSTALNSFCE